MPDNAEKYWTARLLVSTGLWKWRMLAHLSADAGEEFRMRFSFSLA